MGTMNREEWRREEMDPMMKQRWTVEEKAAWDRMSSTEQAAYLDRQWAMYRDYRPPGPVTSHHLLSPTPLRPSGSEYASPPLCGFHLNQERRCGSGWAKKRVEGELKGRVVVKDGLLFLHLDPIPLN